MTRTAADIRTDLGVVRCPTCAQDTITDEVSGCCFFCDTNLVPPQPDADTGARTAYCAHCADPFDPGTYGRQYCSQNCRKTAWHRSPAGKDRFERTQEQRNAAARLRWQQARERAA